MPRRRDGVISTRVGYTGGENDNPTYGNHPGHAEAVEIVFDPERISYPDGYTCHFPPQGWKLPTPRDRGLTRRLPAGVVAGTVELHLVLVFVLASEASASPPANELSASVPGTGDRGRR